VDELSAAQAEQLALWERHHVEIAFYEESLQLWEEQGILDWNSPKKPLNVICEALDIDLRVLDDARRVLLEQQRQANKNHAPAGTEPG
jgi:hypothetical protein